MRKSAVMNMYRSEAIWAYNQAGYFPIKTLTDRLFHLKFLNGKKWDGMSKEKYRVRKKAKRVTEERMFLLLREYITLRFLDQEEY